ncbi:M23 family metallopeptidase [Actinomadura bangladeshensis]|uniref:M23 family metallopeptidase n=1 Tax=Actinomadura bangladeshensis TaxID=453573 RepID=A0A4R4P0D4_9ACTN|nr:M23 family metallopeptidase [Actinomadura bangladeshensis]TDC14040.1 M23 family metallopeptidase [Actinomadura bangladeshensis]
MARRDNGHASRSNTHVSSWAETPARPSSRPASGQGSWSEEPQWPEGSWWSEQADWSERGRKSSRREPSRREMKRLEGRARARQEPQEPPPAKRRKGRGDPFGVRNRGSGRDDPFEARNRRTGRTDERTDARPERPGPRTPGPQARTPGSAVRTPPPSDSRATRSDMPTTPPATPRPAQRDARTSRFDARTRQADARTSKIDAWTAEPDARTRQSDARTRQFDARTAGSDARTAGSDARAARFDARAEGLGRGRRSERARAERRAESRRPGRAASRHQAPPRPGPKATPRRGRRPADKMSIGAIVLSTAVGLSLLGIAERALLDGGPLGGTGGPVGSERAIQPPKPGTDTPAQPRQPGAQQPAAGGGPGATGNGPSLRVLAAQVRKLTLDERGAAAQQAYGAAPAQPPIVGATRTSADRTWVFGTSAIPVPASSTANPEVAFYAAHWTGKEWQVGLSGGKAFAALLADVPAAVMSASEMRLLGKYGSVTAAQAAALVNGTRAGDRLMLPWKIGQVWAMTTSDGAASPRPLGSLAFSGGDGRVLASGTGRLYRFCGNASGNALVMLIHPSGLATTYYGLRSVPQLRDGSVVEQGDAIGRTGTARPCGGAAAPRAEVGFALRGGGGAVPLDGAEIGGWTFRERAEPLLGFAERGALQVLPGGLMANLGPVPAADEEPAPPSPSPSPSPADGAGTAAAPAPAAT